MAEILRTRRISPDTRKKALVSYKISTQDVGVKDTLRVEVTHAHKPTIWTFKFASAQIAGRKSIHFTVKELNRITTISWGGLLDKVEASDYKTTTSSSNKETQLVENNKKIIPGKIAESIKNSFPPVVDPNTTALILGSLPGDESLRVQQYYANRKNQFWKILEAVWSDPSPILYQERIKWLLNHGVGLWDVCHSAFRKGSLDHAISNIVHNDLSKVLIDYPSIRMIIFNGIKARTTFDEYLKESKGVQYVTVISSSSAATKPFDEKVIQWQKYLTNRKEVKNG